MQRNFRTKLWLALGMFALVAALFTAYVWAEKRIDRANDRAHIWLALADELRQSSDDLTRMARTYVITAQPLYKAHYEEILDIRNGSRPRPQHYDRVYWDFVMLDDRRPTPMGPPVSIVELMQHAGISDQEYQMLTQALYQSNELVHLEHKAMEMVTTHPDDSSVREQAIQLLTDENYHKAKSDIMRPINDFMATVKANNSATVTHAINVALLLRYLVIGACCLQIYAMWLLYRDIIQTLGTTVDHLHDYIDSLHNAEQMDSSQPMPHRDSSVYDWLRQLRQRLRDEDRKRSDAEASLARRTQELERLNQELHELSRKDTLTGLNNRRAADERLHDEFTRWKRTLQPTDGVSLLFLDIDHFKVINDQYGHEEGDAVLKLIGDRLHETIRETDFAARYGGEEFLILLVQTGMDGAKVVAEKIRSATASQRDTDRPAVTVSIGVSCFQLTDASAMDGLHRADNALYRAKHAGRNRVEVDQDQTQPLV